MSYKIIQKLYGGFTIIFCLTITIIAVVNLSYSINAIFIQPPYNDEKVILNYAIMGVLALLTFTPQPIALAGYYFSGAIGRNWFSHTLFGCLVLSFLMLLLTFLYVVFAYFMADVGADNNSTLKQISIPLIVLGTLHFTIFPVVFTIAALVVQKVALWKRFVPMISFVLAIIITAILAIIIYTLGVTTGIRSIYYSFREATFPNFFMLGSVAWALIGFLAFLKNTTKLNGKNDSGEYESIADFQFRVNQ